MEGSRRSLVSDMQIWSWQIVFCISSSRSKKIESRSAGGFESVTGFHTRQITPTNVTNLIYKLIKSLH